MVETTVNAQNGLELELSAQELDRKQSLEFFSILTKMGVKAEEIPNDMLPALKEYVLPKLRKLDSNSDTRTLQGIGSAIKRDRKHAYPVLVKVDYTVLPKLVEEDQHVWKFIARETCIVPGYENTKPRELDGRCSGPRYCDRQPNDICWLGHLNKKGIHSEELGFK